MNCNQCAALKQAREQRDAAKRENITLRNAVQALMRQYKRNKASIQNSLINQVFKG